MVGCLSLQQLVMNLLSSLDHDRFHRFDVEACTKDEFRCSFATPFLNAPMQRSKLRRSGVENPAT